MTDSNEMISVELYPGALLDLHAYITDRMEKAGHSDFDSLDLGLELPSGWPGVGTQPTLAQLVVVARKLELRLTITNLIVSPLHQNNQEKTGA